MLESVTILTSIHPPHHLQPFLLPIVLLAAGCHAAPSPDVVASVNGHPIMRAEMEKAYTAQINSDQQKAPPQQDQADAVRLNVLRALIDQEITDETAAKMNLTATEAELDAKLAEMKAPNTEEQFDQQLKATNTTLDDLRHQIRRALTQEKLLNKEINSKITITDANVRDYYNTNREEFNLRVTQYRLARIEVTGLPTPVNNLQNSKAANDADAKKKIEALKVRLTSGEDFATLAMSFSEDPDPQFTSNGGDMGFVTEDDMRSDPTIYAAVMKLKPGQITDILTVPDAQTQGSPATPSTNSSTASPPASARSPTPPSSSTSARCSTTDAPTSSKVLTSKSSATRPRSRTSSPSKSSKTTQSKPTNTGCPMSLAFGDIGFIAYKPQGPQTTYGIT